MLHSVIFQQFVFQRISPDFEGFRLGIQKCRKTIQNACSDCIFNTKGAKVLFVFFRRLTDIRASKKIFLVNKPKKIKTDTEPEDALTRLNRAKQARFYEFEFLGTRPS